MNLDNFIKNILKKTEDKNFSESEIYLNKSQNFEVRLYQGEVDYYEENEEYGLAFRGEINNKMGYSYTEKFSDELIDDILTRAENNANIMDEEEEKIFSGSKSYKELSETKGIYSLDRTKKIDLLKKLEKKIFEYDDRVRSINYCIYADEKSGEEIVNSKDLNLNFKNDISYIYISVVVEDEGEVHTSSYYKLFRDLDEVDPDQFVKKIIEDAVRQFGAADIKSGQYPVILRNEVFIDMLSTFSSTFSAENVQKGLSLFEGKMNEQVANKVVNIVDDPFYAKGYRRTPFDSEGAASKYKEVIKKGKLTTYLHNLKTAKKSSVQTTGNAYRSNHKSKISISPTNMYLKKGEADFTKLKNQIEKGLLVENVQGLHSGANQVSGDFSLSARGFFIENGDIAKPVEQITISGNFLKLLKDIILIGNDFKMGLPGSGHFGSASILVKNLDISGS